MQHGLVTEVVPSEKLTAATDDLAAELSQAAPAALRLGLEAFYHQEELFLLVFYLRICSLVIVVEIFFGEIQLNF